MKLSRMMTDRQFKALMRAAHARTGRRAVRDRFLFYLLGKTGLRVSEALSLRVGDFHLKSTPAFLRVVSLKRRHRRVDEVLLDDRTAGRARAYIAKLPALYIPGAPSGLPPAKPTDPIFPPFKQGRPGASMSRRNALALFRTYARLAALPPALVIHSLRHYRASALLRRTGDLELTRQEMRHSNIGSTQAYQHTDPDRVARQLEEAAREDDE